MTWIRDASRRTRIVALAGIVLLLFILFEIGIRFIPPNGMTYTWDHPTSGIPIFQKSSTNPKTVAYWYQYTNNGKTPVYMATCNGRPPVPGPSEQMTFTFTFYGVPIESFSNDDANDCPWYGQSAGGLPDLFDEYAIVQNPGTSQ